MLPESHAPVLLVAVCEILSLFCHVDVVLFATVSVDGPKDMLYNTTVFGMVLALFPELFPEELESGLVELQHPPMSRMGP